MTYWCAFLRVPLFWWFQKKAKRKAISTFGGGAPPKKINKRKRKEDTPISRYKFNFPATSMNQGYALALSASFPSKCDPKRRSMQARCISPRNRDLSLEEGTKKAKHPWFHYAYQMTKWLT